MRRRGAPTGLDLVLRPPRVEASWWRRWRFEAQVDCREQLFRRYTPLARTIALRHYKRRTTGHGDRHDYDHFAFEGLLQALDRFDPLMGIPFDAYARPRIRGSIADGLASMSEITTQLRHRRRAEHDRLRSLKRDAADEADPLSELAHLLGSLAIGLILERSGKEEADPAPSAYETLESRELAALLAQEVRRLPKGEAEVIGHHYETGLSFAQVATLLGLTRGRVSQLHHAGLKRLRKRIGAWR